MLVGFKLGQKAFFDTVVDPVVGGEIPYGRIVLDEIHKIKIERRTMHGDKVCT